MTFADGAIDVWAGPLANGDVAVITLNRASSQAVIPGTCLTTQHDTHAPGLCFAGTMIDLLPPHNTQ